MPAMTALPVAPNRNDPDTFADRADALVAALPGFVSEANALSDDVTAKAATCASAAQAVAVTGWVSGATYAQGVNVWDPVTLLTYRRKAPGSGTTRPALDPTNWALLTGFGDVDTASVQTILGQKTFSQPIVGSVTGSAATADTAGSANTAASAAACTGNSATATQLTTASGAAPSYAARAWVNFNGVGALAIRASGNVSSVTDNGVGDYTINFSTAMPDTNYAVVAGCVSHTGPNYVTGVVTSFSSTLFTKTTTQQQIKLVGANGTALDSVDVQLAVFR